MASKIYENSVRGSLRIEVILNMKKSQCSLKPGLIRGPLNRGPNVLTDHKVHDSCIDKYQVISSGFLIPYDPQL